MAKVVITLKANLDPDSDIENIKEEANNKIEEFGGEVGKVEVEEIAPGLRPPPRRCSGSPRGCS